MEFKGTKGKWEYQGGDNYGVEIILQNESTISFDRYSRYITNKIVCSREEMEANAKLIASAPELLEMLQRVTNTISNLDKSNISMSVRERLQKIVSQSESLIMKSII